MPSLLLRQGPARVTTGTLDSMLRNVRRDLLEENAIVIQMGDCQPSYRTFERLFIHQAKPVLGRWAEDLGVLRRK
jgi:hypothetical protein